MYGLSWVLLIYISQFQKFLMQEASLMIGSSIKTVDLQSGACEIVFISKEKPEDMKYTQTDGHIYILELNGGKNCRGFL